MSIQNRITYLKRLLSECNTSYYRNGTSPLSDDAYNNLIRELQRLEEGSDIDTNSITQQIGIKPEGIPYTHVNRMLSLGNVFNDNELLAQVSRIEKLADRCEYLVQDKLDGLAAKIVYSGGILRVLATRGDGEVGECLDVTGLDIPHTIPDHSEVDVSGELVITLDTFAAINDENSLSGKDQYISPRNAAVGLVRKDISKLSFIAYSAQYQDGSTFSDTEVELLDKLSGWGFEVVRSSKPVLAEDLLEVTKGWESHENIDTDGQVIKVNDIAKQEQCGNRTSAPRWAFAVKRNSMGVGTVLNEVVWQVGVFGTITPVGLIDPVCVSKSIVTRANLHNAMNIITSNLKIGSGIRVVRSGEVIPQIAGLDPEFDGPIQKPIKIPAVCPSCGSRLRSSGPELFCTNNETCPDRVASQILRMASRDGLDIDGLGPKTVGKLIQAGCVKRPSDIFKLTSEKLQEAGVGKADTRKLLNGISSVSIPLNKLIYSLCIPEIGVVNSKALASVYPNIDKLAIASVDHMLSSTPLNMGEVVSVYEYFGGQNIYDGWPVTVENNSNDTLQTRTWVLTGVFESPRRLLENRLNEMGISLSDRVTANVDAVVVGKKPTEHKVLRAGNLGIRVLTETDLNDHLEGKVSS